MSDRTNDFFNVPLLDAIVIGWINPTRGDFIGNDRWYKEGAQRPGAAGTVLVHEGGYLVIYQVKGYKYHNVANKPRDLEKFKNFARTLPGARLINFYNPKRAKGSNFLYQDQL